MLNLIIIYLIVGLIISSIYALLKRVTVWLWLLGIIAWPVIAALLLLFIGLTILGY